MTLLAVDTEPATAHRFASCLRYLHAASLIQAVLFGYGRVSRDRSCCRCNRERAKLLFDNRRVIKIICIHVLPLLLRGQRGTHTLQFVFGAVGAVGVVDEPVEDVRL